MKKTAASARHTGFRKTGKTSELLSTISGLPYFCSIKKTLTSFATMSGAAALS
jgi:hypothetical protein